MVSLADRASDVPVTDSPPAAERPKPQVDFWEALRAGIRASPLYWDLPKLEEAFKLRLGGRFAVAEKLFTTVRSSGFVSHRGIEVSPRLAPYLDKLDAYAAAQGGSISWTSGHRTRAEQAALYSRWEGGDPNVPFEPLPYEQSKHATGDAADGEASSTALALALGRYAQTIGMGWSAHEPWHFEVR
jgi:hypothetical protein